MHACIASARRAFLLATVALIAACSSSDGTAPVDTPDEDPPTDTIPTPSPAVASIEITGDEEVVVTYAGHLYAAAKNAQGWPVAAAFVWSSSDPTIASVDGAGNIHANGAGSVRITASAAGKSAYRDLRVVPRRVAAFEPTPIPNVLQRGDIGFFRTWALDQRGQRIHEPQLTYTSADPAIVEVNAQGQLIARHGGRVRVTATADGVSTSQFVTVAEQTTYPIRYANGNRLPWLIFEETTPTPRGTQTTRLVMVEASFTLSNVNDAWSQRTVVEEWHISDVQGNRIESKVGTHVSTSSGFLTTDPATSRMYLTTTGSDARLEAWFDGGDVRKLRVYGHPAGGANAFLNDYQR